MQRVIPRNRYISSVVMFVNGIPYSMQPPVVPIRRKQMTMGIFIRIPCKVTYKFIVQSTTNG
jgi:hypothetical protein